MFEGADEDDFMDVELKLNRRCTTDGTQDVTSNDFELDPSHPEVCPVGAPRHSPPSGTDQVTYQPPLDPAIELLPRLHP